MSQPSNTRDESLAQYLVDEFVEEYQEGKMSRRDALKRIADRRRHCAGRKFTRRLRPAAIWRQPLRQRRCLPNRRADSGAHSCADNRRASRHYRACRQW